VAELERVHAGGFGQRFRRPAACFAQLAHVLAEGDGLG
jgi:hypothetical protein